MRIHGFMLVRYQRLYLGNIFPLWDLQCMSCFGCVMRVWLGSNIHVIFRLQEEMLQKEDAENSLRSFRQVCICKV